MIRRRASANGDPEDIMANFDFAPSYEHHAPAFDLEQPNFQSSEFVRSMFNMPSNAGSLTISTEPSLLLPAHQIVSPSSSIGNSSSGPSSPVAGPYTPTQSLHPQSSVDCASDPHMHSELDMNMQSYAGYGWSIGSVWQDETDMGIVNNDFDLSSIPAIEIGGPKYGDVYTASPEAMRMGEYSNEYAQEYSNEYIGDYQDDFSGQYIEGYQSTESSLLGYDKIIGSPEQRF
ncbi:hypothetical protein D9757_012994 [Collybiopsis confluens]|uniref:Uncharacterized protein n=1 Tax=Collybiopsis confluens TaxID=2823264 RepID=A0A8H5GIB9_9AGAR|nr:hypothetical protein D9757_012994 [Collybiopsis confluens]